MLSKFDYSSIFNQTQNWVKGTQYVFFVQFLKKALNIHQQFITWIEYVTFPAISADFVH